ncbi:MAG TPA: shikimate dehydrogenase [Prolixibacteraceae bacterium]|nr:shikimate dehydrogenase [Prolixibacteraceae bacterium]
MKRKFGLIGFPLSHSFSRKFFTDKFQDEGIEAEYLNFELENISQLSHVIASNPDLVGLNVTIPYKEQVIKLLDDTDESSTQIHAVNTIRIHRSGHHVSLHGYNTDIIGFQESIQPLIQKYHHKALVLGTGGASKAVVKALENLKIDTILVSRNPEEKGEISYNDLDEDVMDNYKIIVNTTPIGTYPNIEGCPAIPFELVTPRHLLFDLVYNPEVTEFLKQAKKHGASIKNGLEMLHLQALASWEIWNQESEKPS